MKVSELIAMALRTVIASPMRTMLTMLGVIIGVSSVVTLVAIGQGTSAKVEQQIEGLGSNLLVVNVLGTGRATQMDYDELMQFEQFPEFKTIAPTIVKNNSSVKYDRKIESFSLIGTNDRYLPITKAAMESGRFIAEADLEFRNHVAVLGSETSKTLFGFLDPVGEEINIDGAVFTVIGKLQEKGKNITGTSVDNSVIVPLETARRQFKLGSIRTTYIEATSKPDIYAAQQTMNQYLTYKFKSSQGFILYNQDEVLNTANQINNQFTYLLVGIACISLLVGGIGIMNIMMVTVSERTREIGIRKSIGAKRRNILLQFLVEATVISGLGGIVGLALGIVISLAIPHFYPNQATKISPDISLYAFLFSVAVGIIFGLYPANKASKLRPIDALRFD